MGKKWNVVVHNNVQIPAAIEYDSDDKYCISYFICFSAFLNVAQQPGVSERKNEINILMKL